MHDLTAARTHGTPDALAAPYQVLGGQAYQSAGYAVRVPFPGKGLRGRRRCHARVHCQDTRSRRTRPGHPQMLAARAELRCSTTRITVVVRAFAALELAT